MKKVLVMGSSGQLGNCLLRRFALDADLIWVGYAREDLDVCDAQKILEVLSAERPDLLSMLQHIQM